MPIEAVKIPQNVYVEDKIIGPISLRQLGITGLGAGIGYMFYGIAIKSGVHNIVFLALCWLPAVIAAAFSFLKINDLSLLNIIFLMIEGMQKPKERFWSPHPGLSINLITHQAEKEAADAKSKITTNAGRLAEITRQLEKRQEEINHLAQKDSPSPNALEAVKTQLAHTGEDETGSVETISAVDTHHEPRVGPVNPSHIQTEGLDTGRSIDSITYERLITKQA